MSRKTSEPAIRLRGVRQNNLKHFDLDLPLRKLIVITGLSGSGKSSLAFDTLYAEGQRRYIETFSPYARQFFDRMDKPQVDRIEGIPPAIAIEQRNAIRTTRSTVGTLTEICDYMKLLWPQVAELFCRQCGRRVQRESPQLIWELSRATVATPMNQGPVEGGAAGTRRPTSNRASEALVTFDLALSEKLSLAESLALIAKQGYTRLFMDGRIVRVDEALGPLASRPPAALTVVQDRIKLEETARARWVEACEQAYHFGKGKLAVRRLEGSPAAVLETRLFSSGYHCAHCDLEYREPSPALFSFNHPAGACPTCRGFGRTITIDYNLAIPDRTLTLAEGAVRPWQTGQGIECQQDLLRMCRQLRIPTDVPFEKLPRKWQDYVIEGDPEYGRDEEHQWPRAWYGVKGYFRWLESKAYKMHVRVLLSRYRSYQTCPACQGKRFQTEALLFRAPALAADGQKTHSLADFYQLPVRDARQWIAHLRQAQRRDHRDPVLMLVGEVESRLQYLVEVGLGYLTLDRTARSLSGGETARVNLTACLGTCLVNTLFVLDEPSIGLHPRDTERLVGILAALRDTGNTVVVVEHEPSVMRAADQIVDLGPGRGEAGGHVVFQGPYREILSAKQSLTGQYLSGTRRIEIPARRPVSDGLETVARPLILREAIAPLSTGSAALAPAAGWLELARARCHNLKDLTVRIPLGRFVCVTGVSGSGKSTLLREVLLPALEARLKNAARTPSGNGDAAEEDEPTEEPAARLPAPASELAGGESLGRVILVDQAAIGRTPRSNPGVYVGAFEDIRELFAQSETAQRRGLTASAFSFNSSQGQCERCRGAGFEKIEMQFLSDIFIRCPDCNGRRYRPHILEVTLDPPERKPAGRSARRNRLEGRAARWNIAQFLEATIDEVIRFLEGRSEDRAAQRARAKLSLLQDVGLGYLRLGQPINTLSGGECQRLKLVGHLAESAPGFRGDPRPALFLFDEPTTGLHYDDIRVLLNVFQRLVSDGHSLVVIEHNLEVIKCADWIIDLGPEAGDQGGELVAAGTPETVAACPQSHTGRALLSVGIGPIVVPATARV